MALRKILNVRESALHKTCKSVTNFDDRLHRLLDDMKETLEDAGGVGLAAPQVGILRRVVLVDNGEEVLELVNPELVETSGEPGRPGGLPEPAGKVRPGEAAHVRQGPCPGPERQLVRDRRRGADCPVFLP